VSCGMDAQCAVHILLEMVSNERTLFGTWLCVCVLLYSIQCRKTSIVWMDEMLEIIAHVQPPSATNAMYV
jgi:hypothetical protein